MCINETGVAYPAFGIKIIHANMIQAGTITADLYAQLRNTYVYTFNEPGVDAAHPFEAPFKIVSELLSIVSIKLSFRIMPYRAYSTAAASGGGSTPTSGGGGAGVKTSSSGGGQTTSSGGGQTTSSGGGQTSSTYNYDGSHAHTVYAHKHGLLSSWDWNISDEYIESVPNTHNHDLEPPAETANSAQDATGYGSAWGHSHTVSDHTHAVSDHTHTVDNHTHTVTLTDHTHTVTIANHTHGITYGIHEESNSPTVHFHINNGGGFGGASGNYNSDQLDIDITEDISGSGWKGIRFDTNLRCRIAAIIECKLDITA